MAHSSEPELYIVLETVEKRGFKNNFLECCKILITTVKPGGMLVTRNKFLVITLSSCPFMVITHVVKEAYPFILQKRGGFNMISTF